MNMLVQSLAGRETRFRFLQREETQSNLRNLNRLKSYTSGHQQGGLVMTANLVVILVGFIVGGLGLFVLRSRLGWAMAGTGLGLIAATLLLSGLPQVSEVLGPNSAWFWTLGEFVAIALTLGFVARQVRVQRDSNRLSSLFALQDKWNSEELIACRREVCARDKLDPTRLGAIEGRICGFFEELGLHLERDVFDTATVWDFYSYWVEHYWALLRPKIERYREKTEDDSWYEHFETLNEEMLKYSQKRGIEEQEPTEDQLEIFKTGELQSLAMGRTGQNGSES